MYVVLKQDGNTLTGTAGPNESRQFPIRTGKVEGDRLIFEVQMGPNSMTFDVKPVGNELQGQMQLSEDGHKATAKVVLMRVGS